MGWWIAPDSNNIQIGDGPLDEARRFLSAINNSYVEDLGRPPTLEELEYLLTLSFQVNLNSDILSDFDELVAKKVTIKTEKRKKRTKPKVGDIFSFKMKDGRYGFGRILSFVSVGAVAEIFKYFSKQPIFDHSKINDWLFPPIPIDVYSLLDQKSEGDWDIIESTPDFSLSEKYNGIYFSYGDDFNGHTRVSIAGENKKIDAQESKKYQSYSARGDMDVQDLIKENRLA